MSNENETKIIKELKKLYKENKGRTFNDVYKERPMKYLGLAGFTWEISDKTGIEFKKISNILVKVKDDYNFYLHRDFYLDEIVKIFNSQNLDES